MKPSTVIVIVITILVLAGLTVWVVLSQARNTLSEAEKTGKVAAQVSGDVKDIILQGKKIWSDVDSWLSDQQGG